MEGVERIEHGGVLLAYLIRSLARDDRTSFITENDANLQAGFVVYPAGGSVTPHAHRPVVREIVGTAEFLLVRAGRCTVDLYDDAHQLVTSRELNVGDAILSLSGGHGFRMGEDTILLELKQGPYAGVAEKERFSPQEATDQA